MTAPVRPSGDREALVEAIAEALCSLSPTTSSNEPCRECREDATALLDGPVGLALAQARAEALREAADAIQADPHRNEPPPDGGFSAWLRRRADTEERHS